MYPTLRGRNNFLGCSPFTSRNRPATFCIESPQVYWPYLLMNKKRYAGLLWTKVEKYDKMDTKGLETVRRDNCLLVRKVTRTDIKIIELNKSNGVW